MTRHGEAIFRVEGAAFLVVMALGKLPAGFALPAGLGDIAIGLGGIHLARNLRQSRAFFPQSISRGSPT